MLNEFLFAKIEEEDIGNIWFQQDGAENEQGEAVTFDGDRYLWGAVKDKCYADKPETIDALRTIFVKPLVKYSCTQSIMCSKIGPIL